MPISWTQTLLDQDQSLAGALARRRVQNDDRFKVLQQSEHQRATRVDEQQRSRALDESTRLREAQQAETSRRNTESADDREIAQFMTALGLLEPGSVADPTMVATASRRGLGDLFEANPTTKVHTFKGTAGQLRAIAREKEAEGRAQQAAEREARMAEQATRSYQLQNAALQNQVERTKIQQHREDRMTQADQNIRKLRPEQQIAFRTVLKGLIDKTKAASGGMGNTLYEMSGGLVGSPNTGPDILDLTEQAYRQVTGSPILSPATGTPGGPAPAPTPGTPAAPTPSAPVRKKYNPATGKVE